MCDSVCFLKYPQAKKDGKQDRLPSDTVHDQIIIQYLTLPATS